MNKIKVKSDFSDIYDFWQDRKSPYIWDRRTNIGLNKKEAFKLLQSKGFFIPAFGLVKELYSIFIKSIGYSSKYVIVYLDLNKHCGEKKERLSIEEAIKKYPDNYCSLDCSRFLGESMRILQIGDSYFEIFYKSYKDWRSNIGEGEIEIINYKEISPLKDVFNYPLWAIDLVSMDGIFFDIAIDFNISPGLKGTGIQKYLSTKDIFDKINNKYFEILFEKLN